MDAPAISVIMPVRDGGRFVAEAIRSVLDQTYRDLELIVVDDGSTDDTIPIVEGFAEIDERVRLVRLSGTGIPTALNAGLGYATGRWIARMDADDLSLAHRFERLLDAAAQRPDVVGWASWARALSADGRVSTLMARGPTTTEQFLRQHEAGAIDITAATVLLDRSTVLAVGAYDERFTVGEDIELYDRLGNLGPILTVPDVLYLVRVHGAGTYQANLAFASSVGRFVAARRTAERDGTTLNFEQHLENERRSSKLRQSQLTYRDTVGAWHQRAVIDLFERRRLKGAVRLGGVAILRPMLIIRALRRWRRNHHRV